MTDSSSPSDPADSPTRYYPVKSGQRALRQIGQYQLTRCIGRGGMGEVYEGFQHGLRRRVAVKVLPEFRVADQEMMDRFRREMESIGRLNHPNIVQAYDAGEADHVPYLVMELVDGQDAEHLARKLGPLPVADACEIVRQAALGLQHAHEHNLIHRDIKPSNILISRLGAKVADLGMARLRTPDSSLGVLTNSDTVFGTPDYMAPEQADSKRPLDIRADLYSLGCTLYRLLAGRAPFALPEYDSIVKKIMAHASVPVPPLHRERADLPADLLVVIARLLAKDPGDRYREPGEVAVALAPFVAGHQLARLLESALSGHANAPERTDTPSSSVSAHKLETIDVPTPRPPLPVTVRTWLGPQTIHRLQTVAFMICLAFCAYLLGGRGVGQHPSLPPGGEAPRDLHRDAGSDIGNDPHSGPARAASESPTETQVAVHAAASGPVPDVPPGAPGAAGLPLAPEGVVRPANYADRWTQAFGRTPREILWPGYGGRGTWSLDENVKALLISSMEPRLIQLGVLNGESCTISIDIARKGDPGTTGLFFGYREVEHNDIQNAEFQLIEITPVAEFNGPRYLMVCRRMTLLRSQTRSLMTSVEQRAKRSELFSASSRLEVTLRAGTIQSIRWADQETPELVVADPEHPFEPRDLAGPWGILSERTTVWITHPEMRME